MNQEQRVLLKLVSASIHGNEPDSHEELCSDSRKKIFDIAAEQGVASMLSETLETQNAMSPDILERARFNQTSAAKSVWKIMLVTQTMKKLFDENNIHWVMLKGLDLCSLYQYPEMRRAGDLDILILSQDKFDIACELLSANEFREEQSHGAHHREFWVNVGGEVAIAEIHKRPTSDLRNDRANKELQSIVSESFTSTAESSMLSINFPVLRPTENAFYLLVHMLQHWILSGFSLRILCDWTLFWTKRGALVDDKRFLNMCQRIGAAGFACAATGACILHLGLSADICPWATEAEDTTIEALLDDVFASGEFGKNDKSRILIAEKSSIAGLFVEFHREMKHNFPSAGKIFLTWPALWGITYFRFVRNNRSVRNTTVFQTLKTAGVLSELRSKMRLFQWE